MGDRPLARAISHTLARYDLLRAAQSLDRALLGGGPGQRTGDGAYLPMTR
jgi:hypothetical protein